MITIVDYGLGNIKAFANVYKRLNIQIKIAHNATDLKNAAKIILPGVGAFDYAMAKLNASGMREELEKQVIINKVPILGVCVGMQILAKSSEEGHLSGLGWIDGEVKMLDIKSIPYKTKLPHMGWNTISIFSESRLFCNIINDSRFYFLHSYYFNCGKNEDILSTTKYGTEFASAIHHENIYGVQFHPEKSHSNGIRLLQNFAGL